MDEDLVGYHGTKKDIAKLICTDNFKINEDKNNQLFLGAGIYFFDKCDDAIDWNIKSFIREFSYFPKTEILLDKYSVIESNIKVKKDDILNLDNKDELCKFEMITEKIKGKLMTKTEYRRSKNKTSAIINMMYRRKLITRKVIIKTFVEEIKPKIFDSFKSYPRKMFCVKDKSIIFNNKEVENLNEELVKSVMYFYM